jgi:hypothetical protein
MIPNLFATKGKRMWKRLGLCCLSIALLCAGPGLNVASAQRGGGGRSYSSGGGGGGGRSFSSGSSGRGFSSGSSTSARSYSSGGGSSSGKSYSSGGGSSGMSAKTSSGSTSGGSSSGRSYSSGGGPMPAKTSPGSTSSGSSSGRSYSSGGNPTRPPAASTSPPGDSYPKSANPNRPPSGYATSGKSYSSGSSGDGSAGVKPGRKSSYDARAAQARHQDESRAAFHKGQEPQGNYVDPKGVTRTIDPRDAQIRQLREDLNYERWSNRSWRMRSFYGDYYWGRPVVYYNDPYNSFFWWWLLDQSLEYQALWAYHHRYAMDQSRYNYLLSQNAVLAARVNQLEAQNVARDPGYVPPNFQQRDLMYTDNYVRAVYNPQPVRVSFWHALWVVIKFMLFCAFVPFLIWLVFFKRWGATAAYP